MAAWWLQPSLQGHHSQWPQRAAAWQNASWAETTALVYRDSSLLQVTKGLGSNRQCGSASQALPSGKCHCPGFFSLLWDLHHWPRKQAADSSCSLLAVSPKPFSSCSFCMAGAGNREQEKYRRQDQDNEETTLFLSPAELHLVRQDSPCPVRVTFSLFSAFLKYFLPPIKTFFPLCFLSNSFPTITSALPEKSFSFLSPEHFPQISFPSFPLVLPS